MKFVDLAKYKFIIEPRYYFYGWSSSPKITARQSLATDFFEKKKQLTATEKIARKNRRLLKRVMSRAGFKRKEGKDSRHREKRVNILDCLSPGK